MVDIEDLCIFYCTLHRRSIAVDSALDGMKLAHFSHQYFRFETERALAVLAAIFDRLNQTLLHHYSHHCSLNHYSTSDSVLSSDPRALDMLAVALSYNPCWILSDSILFPFTDSILSCYWLMNTDGAESSELRREKLFVNALRPTTVWTLCKCMPNNCTANSNAMSDIA